MEKDTEKYKDITIIILSVIIGYIVGKIAELIVC